MPNAQPQKEKFDRRPPVPEEFLPDRRRFDLPARQWEEFQVALSAPTRQAPRLAKLMRTPGVFDRGLV
jgi:uncharacterized protein (DUF1778 family)